MASGLDPVERLLQEPGATTITAPFGLPERKPRRSVVRSLLATGVGPALSWGQLCLLVDVLMLGATVLVSEFGRARAGVPSTPALWTAIFLVAIVVGLHVRGSYATRLGLHLLEDLRVVVVTTAIAAMAVLSLRVLLSNDPYVAAQTARLWVFATVYLAAGRVALGWSELAARRRGEVAKPTLVIGAGRVGRLVARRLLERPEFGLRPVGFLDKEPLHDLPESPDLPVLGASWDLGEIVEEHGIEHVVVTFSTAPHPVLLRTIQECQDRDIDVTFVPRLYEKVTERMSVERLGGMPLLVARATNPRAWQFRVKYVADRVVAAALLFLVLPVFAVVALAVRVSLGRPVFFRQLRVGRDGRVFEMLKFRSMRPDEGNGNRDYGADESARLTRLGQLLRMISLDELPQLINVVRGEMSLVGPRPERPELAEIFEETVYRYGDRDRVKAGITGWAQVHGIGRGADRFGGPSLADRAEWDNYYIENWSLWLDLKIVLMTLGAMLRFRQPT